MKKDRTIASMSRAACVILAVAVVPGACEDPPGTSLPVRTTVSSPDHAALIDSARSHLRRAADPGVGLAAAVTVGGRLVWLEGVGYADLEGQAPVEPGTTRFRIYSVTKPMTAVAAARLMERGGLDPSAPIARYLPDPPPAAETVTPMQLATHTSGIRHYRGQEAANLRHCATVSEAISIFRDDPLVHPPGERETYSSWGFVLLSAVVEGAGGSPFSESMDRLVFGPAGMSRTVLDDPTRPVEGRASFYEEAAPVTVESEGERTGIVEPASPVDNTCKWGAGAYLSTAEDVARFGAAMLDGDFLSPRSLELFMRGEDVYRVQGIGTGGAAFLSVDRTRSLSVALLSNASGETAGPEARRTAEAIHLIFARSTTSTPPP